MARRWSYYEKIFEKVEEYKRLNIKCENCKHAEMVHLMRGHTLICKKEYREDGYVCGDRKGLYPFHEFNDSMTSSSSITSFSESSSSHEFLTEDEMRF